MKLYSNEYLEDYIDSLKKLHRLTDNEASVTLNHLKNLNKVKTNVKDINDLLEMFSNLSSSSYSGSRIRYANFIRGFCRNFPAIALCVSIQRPKTTSQHILNSLTRLFRSSTPPINRIKQLISEDTLSMVHVEVIHNDFNTEGITELGYEVIELICTNKSNLNKFKLLK